MLVEVKVPVLAESVAEATLLNWHKKPGDPVSRGDSLIDIETDKVTLEVAAPNNGILKEILKGDGEDVASDEVIARIETEAGAPAAAPEQRLAPEQRPTPVPEQHSLPVGEAADISPKLSPAVRHLLEEYNVDAGDIPTAGDRLTKEDVIKYLKKERPPEVKEPPSSAPPPPPVTPPETPEPVTAEHAPAPEPVMAPPPEPVMAPPPEPPSAPPPQSPVAAAPEPPPSSPMVAESIPAPSGDRPERRVSMTRLRQRTAERLLSAQHENAILTTFNEINMQAVMDLRNRYKEEFEQVHGIKLGFMSFFTKAVIGALKKFPVVNASIDGNDIIYHGYYDIGIAVSSDKGLVVPVIRDADMLSFAQIETGILEYAEKARNAKLTMDDLTGGTFTITNGGIFGSLLSTPILNPPQSAILGMHAIQERPVAEQGQVVIRPMMYVALSYDHRIIDGREAVQFLVAVKYELEDPARLLFQI